MQPRNRVETINLYCVLIFCLLLISSSAQDLIRRRTSNLCRVDNDCPRFASCEHNTAPTENGHCVCHHGYIIVAENKKRECYPVATELGDECEYDDQCHMNLSTESECFGKACRCKDGTHYVPRARACYTSVKINDFCRLTNNCIGDDTVCRFGVCLCPANTHANEDRTICLNDVLLGDNCSEEAECITKNSRCHDICRCRVSHTISQDQTKCLKIAEKLNDECEETGQCATHITHSICDSNGTCVCRPGYHENYLRCFVTVELGGICEVDENCSFYAGSICSGGRCVCKEGYQQISGYCSSAFSIKMNFYFVLVFLLIISFRHKMYL